jgi:DNA-binding MarR family transcriptional regulator
MRKPLPPPPPDDELIRAFMAGVQLFHAEFGPHVSAAAGMMFLHLCVNEEATQSELADAFGLSKFVVSRACRALADAKMIRKRIEGREKVCSLAPRGHAFKRRWLKQMQAVTRVLRKAARDSTLRQ